MTPPCSLVPPKKYLLKLSSITFNLAKGYLLKMLLLDQKEPHEEAQLCSLEFRLRSHTWGCVQKYQRHFQLFGKLFFDELTARKSAHMRVMMFQDIILTYTTIHNIKVH